MREEFENVVAPHWNIEHIHVDEGSLSAEFGTNRRDGHELLSAERAALRYLSENAQAKNVGALLRVRGNGLDVVARVTRSPALDSCMYEGRYVDWARNHRLTAYVVNEDALRRGLQVDLRFLDHRGRETQRLNMRSFLPAVLDDSRGVHVSIRRIAHTLQELEGAPQLTEPFATSAETMLETALFRFVYEVMDHFESSHPTRAQQIERGG